MNRRVIVISGFVSGALLAVSVGFHSSAEAKTTKSRTKSKVKVQLESYPALEEVEVATESEPSEIRVSRTQSVSGPASSFDLEGFGKSKALEERVALLEKRYVERAAVNPASGAPGTTARASTAAYDMVPAGKTDMIATRLKLVETILRESGRAYDYRVMTTSQLQQILTSLRK